MQNTDYQSEFILFETELKSFIYRIVTHKQEMDDIFQDTFIKVFDNIDTFRGDSSFKTWVFKIATNKAKDSLRAQNRWGGDWMNLVKDAHVSSPELMNHKFEIVNNSPHGKFVMQEHLNYCFNCTSNTLTLTNQIILLLKEVYSFKISEIMLIVDLTEGKVKHGLADSRKDMNRIFEHKCALINKNGTCSQCTGLNNIFNPKQNTQKEVLKMKIIKEQKGENYEQLLDLRLQMVKTIDPLSGEGFDLHNYLIENSPNWAKEQLSKN